MVGKQNRVRPQGKPTTVRNLTFSRTYGGEGRGRGIPLLNLSRYEDRHLGNHNDNYTAYFYEEDDCIVRFVKKNQVS